MFKSLREFELCILLMRAMIENILAYDYIIQILHDIETPK